MKRLLQKYIAALMLLTLVCCLTGCKSLDYKDAQKFFDSGEYLEAAAMFEALQGYKDSAERANESRLLYAERLFENGEYLEAAAIFEALEDYKHSAMKLNESRLLYAEGLCGTGEYEEALEFFQMCQEDDALAAALDRVAEGLVNKEDYKNAKNFLYLHDMDEGQMKEFHYQYLVWQMANREYDDTADTFTAIRGYKDTLTNDTFAGARLLSMKTVDWSDTEINFRTWRGDTVIQTLSFPNNTLHFQIYGTTVNLISTAITNNVDIEDSWEFYFEGRTIYIKDGEKFVKGGSIGKFNPASEETNESVTLSLDLPGMWKITNTVFEKKGDN